MAAQPGECAANLSECGLGGGEFPRNHQEWPSASATVAGSCELGSKRGVKLARSRRICGVCSRFSLGAPRPRWIGNPVASDARVPPARIATGRSVRAAKSAACSGPGRHRRTSIPAGGRWATGVAPWRIARARHPPSDVARADGQIHHCRLCKHRPEFLGAIVPTAVAGKDRWRALSRWCRCAGRTSDSEFAHWSELGADDRAGPPGAVDDDGGFRPRGSDRVRRNRPARRNCIASDASAAVSSCFGRSGNGKTSSGPTGSGPVEALLYGIFRLADHTRKRGSRELGVIGD
jgi:hypothetical protein